MTIQLIRRMCLAAAVSAGSADRTAAATMYEHALFDFSGPNPAKGWYFNAIGKGKKERLKAGRFEVVPGRQGGTALRLTARDPEAHNFVSPRLPDGKWRNSEYEPALVLWYRGDGTPRKVRVQLITAEKGKYWSYSGTLFLGDETWQRTVLKRFWRRPGTPKLDASKLARIHFQLPRTGVSGLTLGYVGLLSKGRDVLPEDPALPQVVAPPLASAPTIDGNLDDPAWRQAARIDGLRVFDADGAAPAKYPTVALIGYRDGVLYIGVRLKGEDPKNIPATWRGLDTPIWQDSCLEFYLDPGDTNRDGYQFVVNAIGGRVDIGQRSKAWNGKWTVKTQKDAKDGWSVEIACDLRTFGPPPKPGDVWGFNLKRHVVSPKGEFLEVAGWSQGSWRPVSGFGTLMFGPAAATRLAITDVELRRMAPGKYVCRLVIPPAPPGPKTVQVRAQVGLLGGQHKQTFAATVQRTPGKDAVVHLPIAFAPVKDGRCLLALELLDTRGRPAAYAERTFLFSRPVPFKYSDIAIWPPPQDWTLSEGWWTLPETPTLRLEGKGDRFPVEHLTHKIAMRYGARVRWIENGPADLTLTYRTEGIKPEGFAIDVTPKGVRVRARDGRGMYYAVRGFLDLMQQSSLAADAPRAHCVRWRDWPDIPIRVAHHYLAAHCRYRGGPSVEAFKKLVYDQVAGGRFNLLILTVNNGMRYDTHPELAHWGNFRSRPYEKSEVREIVEFARRHYVDVAPGFNTPGHASWIVQAGRPELREDGDRDTLCTRNPDTRPLLRDLFGELMEVFRPARYFHMSGDEVRWKTAAVPEDKRCPLCKDVPKAELVLEHWTWLAGLCGRAGVAPILWDDMLSPTWNGGAPNNTSAVLPKLPKDIIIAHWGGGAPLAVPPEKLRKLGFAKPWWISTAFVRSKWEAAPAMSRDYAAFGIGETTFRPWTTFAHFDSRRVNSYTAAAIHAAAACAWKPAVAATPWARFVAAGGRHWMKTMQVADWGVRRPRYKPVPIDPACNETTIDGVAGDGHGWMDLGPEHDLSSLPRGALTVGAVPFLRPNKGPDAIVLDGTVKAAMPVPVEGKRLGFVFLHTAFASKDDIPKLHKRFLRDNTSRYGMPIAWYRVRYADGKVVSVPMELGWNVQFWDCGPEARIMMGARTFWAGFTQSGRKRDPNTPDACAWTLEWKNPRPSIPVRDIVFVSAETEAAAVCLGIAAVE
ncbi:MAG: family 20 glycosylhydrolase [Kiritimatiellaeota bacterium]|nr:family 20 glycosylhydrolase [Kiritimatiellota bacterium]